MLDRLREATDDAAQRYDALRLVVAMCADQRDLQTLRTLRLQLDDAFADVLDPTTLITSEERRQLIDGYRELGCCLDAVEDWAVISDDATAHGATLDR